MGGVIGALGAPARPRVDGRGRVTCDGVGVDWWIGGDDRWHIPAEESGIRQVRLRPAPVYETRARVPAGDAVQRVYAASGPGAPVVIEVENDSPAPFAVAFVVSVACGAVELDGPVVRVDGEPRLTLSHAPRFWAAGANVREVVTTGAATAVRDTAWHAPVDVAVLVPVAHRTTVRLVIGNVPVAPLDLPGAGAVVRGWGRHLDRGLRTELPDELQARVDSARADLLLAVPAPRVAAALEDWGFDAEFEVAWSHLGFLGRRAARRRVAVADPWGSVHGAGGVDLLDAIREVLVREARDHVDVLPGLPAEWRGVNLAVHDVPLRSGGRLSYALRWHGERPALLWDAPAGLEVRTPAIDPGWAAPGGVGEALLS